MRPATSISLATLWAHRKWRIYMLMEIPRLCRKLTRFGRSAAFLPAALTAGPTIKLCMLTLLALPNLGRTAAGADVEVVLLGLVIVLLLGSRSFCTAISAT